MQGHIIGYVRLWPSGPKGQEAALRDAGCTLIYTDKPKMGDPLIQRGYAIKALRGGSKLVITDAEVFGRNPAELIAGLAEMHDTTDGGACLHILSAGRDFVWHPGADQVVDFLDLAINGNHRRQTAAGHAAAAGKGGRPSKLRGKAKAAAQADWIARNGSQAEIAQRHGVSVLTMRREFGSWTDHN